VLFPGHVSWLGAWVSHWVPGGYPESAWYPFLSNECCSFAGTKKFQKYESSVTLFARVDSRLFHTNDLSEVSPALMNTLQQCKIVIVDAERRRHCHDCRQHFPVTVNYLVASNLPVPVRGSSVLCFHKSNSSADLWKGVSEWT
jgi:hypothetical protein